ARAVCAAHARPGAGRAVAEGRNRMKSFEYAAPKTLKEATALLGQKWGETELLAGGTDLITSLKQELTAPKRVVSLKNIPELRGIQVEKNALGIGAMTSLAELV